MHHGGRREGARHKSDLQCMRNDTNEPVKCKTYDATTQGTHQRPAFATIVLRASALERIHPSDAKCRSEPMTCTSRPEFLTPRLLARFFVRRLPKPLAEPATCNRNLQARPRDADCEPRGRRRWQLVAPRVTTS